MPSISCRRDHVGGRTDFLPTGNNGHSEALDKPHRPSSEGTFAFPLKIRTQPQVKRAG
jgi:hypothetical protein